MRRIAIFVKVVLRTIKLATATNHEMTMPKASQRDNERREEEAHDSSPIDARAKLNHPATHHIKIVATFAIPASLPRDTLLTRFDSRKSSSIVEISSDSRRNVSRDHHLVPERIVSLSELEIRATLLLLLLLPMCVCTLVYSSSRYYVRCARVEEEGKKFGERERERERERNALLWYDITCYYDSDGSMKSMKWIG